MATNKNAQISYHALDRCLGNWSKRFYIEDLIKACNDALYDDNGSEGVQKRQVQADLDFLESQEGYKMWKQNSIDLQGNNPLSSVEKPHASLEYEGTPGIKKLLTRETPKQILSEDFPKRQWPISGGWGYSQENAVVVEVENSWDGVSFEYKYLEYRTYEDAIIFRPKGQQLAGFRFEKEKQSLVHGSDGKSYDRVTVKVSAYTEEDFAYFKNDWDSHNGYENDEAGKARHLQIAESKVIKYDVTRWFDISKFYGKG